MGRLTMTPSRLSRPPARVAGRSDAEGHVQGDNARAWYKTQEWQALRPRVFLRDGYTCQCGCGTLIVRPAERVADHIEPHRGDRDRFFDEANVQTLWKPHHDGWKQRLERRGG